MSGSQIPGVQQLLQQIQPQDLGSIDALAGGAPPIQPQPQPQGQQGPLGGNPLQSVQQLIQALGQGGNDFQGVGAATPNQQPLPTNLLLGGGSGGS